MKQLAFLFVLTTFFVACTDQPKMDAAPPADEAKKANVDYKSMVTETNKVFADGAIKGDSAAVAAVYHPDAEIFPPNMEKMRRDAMASAMAGFGKMGITSFSLDTKEIFEGDESFTEVGTYEMGDGKKTVDKGKYMVVWKKDGDKWKLYRDIWNSDNAPAPASKK
jgi:ketosteroid isomerase-like protein